MPSEIKNELSIKNFKTTNTKEFDIIKNIGVK